MKNISYRNTLLFLISIVFILASITLYNFLETMNSSNIGNISKKHFKNKAIEREESVKDFLKPYKFTIKAIASDSNFLEYLSGNIDRKIIENYFLSIKKSLPCLVQVRYLDNNANEIIKVKGTSIALFEDSASSEIIPLNKLQNKSHRDYMKVFFTLQKDEVGLSNIDLNIENKKIVVPRQPTLRLAMNAYDKNGLKQGILILNVCLKSFFKAINKTTLYNVYLVDKNGKYILHDNKEFGVLNENAKYSIKNEFPHNYKAILEYDEYFGENFFSYKLNDLDNEQNIKIILKLKFNEELENRTVSEKRFIIYFIVFIVVIILLIAYITELPDKLRKEVIKTTITDSITQLPNRVALIEDLKNKEYEDSLIVLVSINKLFKIQNSYGQEISDILINKITKYLNDYKDENIKKLYINTNNIFILKYKYTHYNSLIDFLNKLLQDLESKLFKLEKNSLDFSLEVTIAVSDPKKLNNNIEELREAENALEIAIDKHLHLNIFNANNNSIEKQKENIFLSKEIKKAIENNNIILHYQPILNNHTNIVDKYECLIRIEADNKIIYPDEFIPVAKEIKKYTQLSKALVEKSFEFFKDKGCEFSINISMIDIENEEFSLYLIDKIKEYEIGSKLVLEIVEQDNIEDYEILFSFLKRVKELNCKIAIDDFGSGYSNFEYIIKMSEYIDYIKIDGSLVKNLLVDEKSVTLLQSIIFLCSQLKIKTIAEYVEDEKLKDFLFLIGIDYSQGYYIGKPSIKIEDNAIEEQ